MRKIQKGLGWVLLLAGSLLSSDAGAAMLTAVQGDVQVDTGRGFTPTRGATSLGIGDKLQLGKGAAAQIVFSDGCILPPADGITMTIGAQSPCAIRASYPKPSYVGGAASLYTHAITAPSKKRPVKHRQHTKFQQKPNLNKGQWTTTTSPSRPVNQPFAGHSMQANPLQGPPQTQPPLLQSPVQVQPLPPAFPPLPSPVIATTGPGLSTGMLLVGGAVAAGGAALVVTLSQKNNKAKTASP